MSSPLPISAVNHLSVVTKRLEASRRFYRDVLGFREVERPNFNFAGAWLFNYGLMIHIMENPSLAGDPSDTIQTRAIHLALHSDDLAAAARTLEQHGIPYQKNEVPGGIIKQLFFQDPDGFHIEIGKYPPTPPYLD